MALTLLDLSLAFDTVDHSIMLSMLQSRFSVTGHPLEWFRSHLSGRTEVFVRRSPTLQPWLSAIYLVYTECPVNTFSVYSVQYHLFADDTQN